MLRFSFDRIWAFANRFIEMKYTSVDQLDSNDARSVHAGRQRRNTGGAREISDGASLGVSSSMVE
jgi:hypothetical protein